MKRQTVKVEDIVEYANTLLANPDLSQEFKRGVASLLEAALFKADRYSGFNYTYWLSVGFNDWQKAVRDNGGKHVETKPYLGNEYDRVYYLNGVYKKPVSPNPADKKRYPLQVYA